MLKSVIDYLDTLEGGLKFGQNQTCMLYVSSINWGDKSEGAQK